MTKYVDLIAFIAALALVAAFAVAAIGTRSDCYGYSCKFVDAVNASKGGR